MKFRFLSILLTISLIETVTIVPCFDKAETYAGAHVINIEMLKQNSHLKKVDVTYINGESSTFMFQLESPQSNFVEFTKEENIINSAYQKSLLKLFPGQGIPVQTADVLDFSAVHLSSLEKYGRHIVHAPNRKERRISDILDLINASKAVNDHWEVKDLSSTGSIEKCLRCAHTLVAIPYFAKERWRSGESMLESRPSYLNATVYGLQRLGFKNIVVATINREDYDFVHKESGLKLLKTMLLSPPKAGKGSKKGSKMVPIYMLQELSKRLTKQEAWLQGMKALFYIEADTMLAGRGLDPLLAAVDRYPWLVLQPHRIMTFLPGHLAAIRPGRDNRGVELLGLLEGRRSSCCADLLNGTTRKHWRTVRKHPRHLFHILSLSPRSCLISYCSWFTPKRTYNTFSLCQLYWLRVTIRLVGAGSAHANCKAFENARDRSFPCSETEPRHMMFS